MTAKLKRKFEPRARLLLQLGDQLIKNESIALLELVKNSYDADASRVEVKMENIDEAEKGIILIEDDGSGMDRKIIDEVWLEPGSDYKAKLFKHKYRTTKFHRTPLGEKGIGRFGAHKLGKKIEVVTRMRRKKEYVVSVNWADFEKTKYLKDAPVEIIEREPEIFQGVKTGTRIKITDLRNPWKRSMVRKVYKDILAINSPFKSKDAIKIEFDVDKREWLEGLLKFENIKKAALYYFNCVLDGQVVEKFTYEFIPWENMTALKPRTIKEGDSYIEEHRKMLVAVETVDEETKKKKKDQQAIDLGKYKIGKVSMKGYIFDRDPIVLDLCLNAGKDDLRNYLDENGGVRIYRDKMRVNEYGEPGNDWLGLDIERVNIPGKKISNNLILAAIDLERNDSTDLIEKTNREGFIENDAFREFSLAVRYALGLVETLRNIDKSLIREKYNTSQVAEPVIDSLNDLRVVVEKKVEDQKIRDEISENIKKVEKDYREISEIMLTAAGAGLNLSIFVHEIEKGLARLSLALQKEDASQKVLDLSKHLSDLVDGYTNIIRQSKQSREKLTDLLKGAIFNNEFRFENHKIDINNNAAEYSGDSEIKCAKRLVLIAIMNLMDNSIYWLAQKQKQLQKVEKFSKKLYFDIIDDELGFIKFLIADNAKGFTIPKNRLGRPFMSEKEDGMGLGLHLTTEIMKAHHGRIEFPEWGEYDIPREFKNGATVVLVFPKEKQ
ncbi:MAG: ATP-binding protein [Candidatus Omnitrophota bacterium]